MYSVATLTLTEKYKISHHFRVDKVNGFYLFLKFGFIMVMKDIIIMFTLVVHGINTSKD